MNLAAILKDSNYKLSQFTPAEIETLEKSITIKHTKSGDVAYINCLVRCKEIKLTPEETVRQLYLQVLTQRYNYPVNRIAVEYAVTFGREKKKADIAIFDKDRPNVPYIIVELKKPKLKDGKDQLRSYCNATGAPIGVWTNGNQISYYQRKDPNYFEDITDIPNANQTLADILNERFTLEDLIKKDKLVNEKKSLKALIEEMEDEVLANAGVDVFEELFKLIFTKLYDEWLSGRGNNKKTRLLEFRNTGQTETALKNKIQDLFDRAKKQWEGVFSEDSKITLTLSHLSVCVSSLENVKLFNSNLDVVDEAFEYLINKSSKGEKGQYFTPRYVIDMCVKMLNPQEDEYMIDTAAGSSGFPVHTMFHVWGQILKDEGINVSNLFSLEDKPPRCEDYVRERVFAIDFDEKAVRVARTLNLIAGDGQTNVLHLNTLDFERWDEVVKDDDWQNIYFEGFKRLRKLRKNKDSNKEFLFDVLMANPPFAGDIKESQIIHRYDLAKKPNGSWQSKVGRDILFIERNLDFLKPGGRMAIILPQGRFNNSSDKDIRDYIAERCRILAVVGLHGNTFKPHTGTKTSVLFVQKWNDDPKMGALCPKVEDYNIFFATMRKSGKDNSGEKIWKRVFLSSEEGLLEQEKDKDLLQDNHGHLIVDHDLFNHEGMTEDGIAEAFIEFAKKENLSFFDFSLSVTPFDGEKYQRLMDRLEASEVSFIKVSEENEEFRIDSEYYHPSHIVYDSLVKAKQHQKLGNLCKLIAGPFGSTITADHYVENASFRYIRGKDIQDFFIDNNDPVYIGEELFKSLPQFHLNYLDILVTVVGMNFGKAAIVLSGNYPAVFSCKSSLIRDIKINPFFLVTYLSCKYGYQLIRRGKRGAAQPGINLFDLQIVSVPIFSNLFQKKIEFIVNECCQKINNESVLYYQEAEELLLSELNLQDWQPTEENISVKSFSYSVLAFNRLDAEYYQPKYDELLMQLHSCDTKLLKDIVNIRKSIEPGSDSYQSDGIPFIRVSNLSKFEISSPEIHISHNFMDKIESLKPKKNTILLSKDGSIGIAYKLENDLQAITSGAILHLKIKKQVPILPDYLTLILNSIIVRLQAQRDSGGSIIQHWRISEIENIVIPVIDIAIQEHISAKIQMSFTKRQQAKKLLEIAKIGVEKAIETDETTATNWINEKLVTLGINIS